MSAVPHAHGRLVRQCRRTRSARTRRGEPDDRTLHHAALTVTDIDKSTEWYRDLFGWAELSRDQHHGGRAGTPSCSAPRTGRCSSC